MIQPKPHDNSVRILTGPKVESILAGQEAEVIEVVRAAYLAHHRGQTLIPHSTFLRFGESANRIIALPAWLGGDFDLAGVKWIASFPGNVAKKLPRASAVTILNSGTTGRPDVILEGSYISAIRTAASAALASQVLASGREFVKVGLVGCGLINLEVLRFLLHTHPRLREAVLLDLDSGRANVLAARFSSQYNGLVSFSSAATMQELLGETDLVSFATTATSPYVAPDSETRPGALILHVSLRDLAPEFILKCDNVVDDVDHVCRAETSMHLAEQMAGNREFVRCSLAEVIAGEVPARDGSRPVTVFSPFGLGALDLAVAALVRNRADRADWHVVEDFFPSGW